MDVIISTFLQWPSLDPHRAIVGKVLVSVKICHSGWWSKKISEMSTK